MANDGGPGERLKGQKKRTNPHDIAKREAEKCKYGLDFIGVGKERSNDLCTVLCHLTTVHDPWISRNSPVTQMQFYL